MLLYALLISTVGFAKDPCKALTTKTDAFGVEERFQRRHEGAWLHKRGEDVTLRFSFAMFGESAAVIPAGTPIQVALSEGTMPDLVTLADVAPTVKTVVGAGNATDGMTYTEWVGEVPLSKDDVLSLARKPLAMRVEINGKAVTRDIDSASEIATANAASCLAAIP